ncbi:MAG: hypothetical protein JO216_13805 [Hyphomicrobiales bacterium]|nr:hypothetical protein [Hyphomicrobiales bacterium]
MIAPLDHFGRERLQITDGEIALINLESARRRSWSRFFQDPLRDGIAETIVEQEQLTAQFVGDVQALDRLDALVKRLTQAEASARIALVEAQVASLTHRFADARRCLERAHHAGAASAEMDRLRLTIDQACGANLEKVLDERRAIARQGTRTQDLIALAALLVDLREFAEADRTYRQALRTYCEVSPFPVAWACFQLGVLWGELVPQPDAAEAARWYREAINCLPAYTKARVHLAEIYLSDGRADEAEALLLPAISSGDPEVSWRVGEVLIMQGRQAEGEAHMQTAEFGFETLLDRHLLAFVDHAAEFYAANGKNWPRAVELTRINVANRPTPRAFEQALDIASHAGDRDAARELFNQAKAQWGKTTPFSSSTIAKRSSYTWEVATA